MSTVITTAPLSGRVTVVTGAPSGIGEATALRLAGLGAHVAVAARRIDNRESLAARITAAGGTALAVPLDVTDRSPVTQAAAHIADRLGPVDLVFNDAGVELISPVEEARFDEWQRQIDLNVIGVMNVIGSSFPSPSTQQHAASRPTSSPRHRSRPPESWRNCRCIPERRPTSAS
jgi:NADP-dependent 3-hydroxy acid dehydrogenase YdfG